MKKATVILWFILAAVPTKTEPPGAGFQVEPRYVMDIAGTPRTSEFPIFSGDFTVSMSGVRPRSHDLPDGTRITAEVYDPIAKVWVAMSCMNIGRKAHILGVDPGKPAWEHTYPKDSEWGRMTAAGPFPFANRVRVRAVTPDGQAAADSAQAMYGPPPLLRKPVGGPVRPMLLGTMPADPDPSGGS